MRASSLLRVLVEREGDEVAAALHERVWFRQADGTVHEGRGAVLAMFARSERDVRYNIVGETHDTVRVMLEVPDVPGAFSFELCGRAEGAVLVEVWVER